MTRPENWKQGIKDFARTLGRRQINANDLVTLQESLLILDPNGISDINLRAWINRLRVVVMKTTKNATKGEIRGDDHALNQSNHFNAINNQIRKNNGKFRTDNAKSNAINNARRADILRAKKADLIEKNKHHHEPTLNEAGVRHAASYPIYAAEECIDKDGFVHVFVGSGYDPSDINGAIDAACDEACGGSSHRGGDRAIPNILWVVDGSYVTYDALGQKVEEIGGELIVSLPYTGTNCVNCDSIEKETQRSLLASYPNDNPRTDDKFMFTSAGKGTCRPRGVEIETPYPYYTGLLTCSKSMAEVGIRRGTESDRKKRKTVSSTSSSSSSSTSTSLLLPSAKKYKQNIKKKTVQTKLPFKFE